MLIGAHESIQGGFFRAVERAQEDGCESLQIFTRSPSVWKAKPILDEDAKRFEESTRQSGLENVIVHDSYLINLCAKSPSIRQKSLAGLTEEAQRCEQLGIDRLVLHPGSPGDLGDEQGIHLVSEGLVQVLTETSSVSLLLENTAGQGKGIGHRFEHLAQMIALAGAPDRLGVCFDTAHALAAGYDLSTPDNAVLVFDEFDQVVGHSRLRAIHLNDSLKPLGSRVDRHARIGQGEIGLETFRWMVNAERFSGLPAVLETPIEKKETYAAEVTLLKSLRAN